MQDFTQGSIPRHIVKMAVPVFFGMLFQTLYLLVDLFFVSKLGPAVTAGVNAAGTLQFIVMALTQVLSVGTMVLIAHASGRKDQADASLVFHQSLLQAALCMAIVAGVGYPLAGVYASTIGASPATAEAARAFLYGYLPSVALQFALVTVAAALRGTGVAKPTMVVQVLSVLLNAALAPVLIAGKLTGHPLGAFGAGLASTISTLFAVVLLLWYFHKLEHFVAFRVAELRLHWPTWGRILKIGLPSGGEFALMFAYQAMVYGIIRGLGETAQAGFGVGSRVMQSLFIPAMAIAFAASPVAGQNVGAGNGARARETFLVAAGMEIVLMLVLTLVAQLEGATLVGIFTTEPGMVAVATTFLAIISWNFAAQGVIFTASGMFQALGNTVPAMLSSATRVVSFAVPALWLARRPGFELRQLWILSIATVTLQAVVSVWLLNAAWKKKMAQPAPAWPGAAAPAPAEATA